MTENAKFGIFLCLAAVLIVLQVQMWKRLQQRHAELTRDLMPHGTALLIPFREFLRAWRSPEMRAVFTEDIHLRIRAWLMVVLAIAILVLGAV